MAAAKAANAKQPDTHDYSEAQTRDTFIDLLPKEVGWPLDQPQDREFPVTGMPTPSRADFSPRGASAPPDQPPVESAMPEGTGRADYVLWGQDGKPLAVIEAKRTTRDAAAGQQQAKLYADCLAKQYGQRPVIFYTNGHQHWLWDDTYYPPRTVQGFLKRDELELIIQRRGTRRRLGNQPIDPAIVERFYQTRAIRRIDDWFETERHRRALEIGDRDGRTPIWGRLPGNVLSTRELRKLACAQKGTHPLHPLKLSSSPETPKPTPCPSANTAPPMWCRTRFRLPGRRAMFAGRNGSFPPSQGCYAS